MTDVLFAAVAATPDFSVLSKALLTTQLRDWLSQCG